MRVPKWARDRRTKKQLKRVAYPIRIGDSEGIGESWVLAGRINPRAMDRAWVNLQPAFKAASDVRRNA